MKQFGKELNFWQPNVLSLSFPSSSIPPGKHTLFFLRKPCGVIKPVYLHFMESQKNLERSLRGWQFYKILRVGTIHFKKISNIPHCSKIKTNYQHLKTKNNFLLIQVDFIGLEKYLLQTKKTECTINSPFSHYLFPCTHLHSFYKILLPTGYCVKFDIQGEPSLIEVADSYYRVFNNNIYKN